MPRLGETRDRLSWEVPRGLAAEDDPFAAVDLRQHVLGGERLADRLDPLLDDAVVVVKAAAEAGALNHDARDAERLERAARVERRPAGPVLRAGVGGDDVGGAMADHADRHRAAGTWSDTIVRVPGADSSVSSAPIRAARSRIIRMPTPSRGMWPLAPSAPPLSSTERWISTRERWRLITTGGRPCRAAFTAASRAIWKIAVSRSSSASQSPCGRVNDVAIPYSSCTVSASDPSAWTSPCCCMTTGCRRATVRRRSSAASEASR